MLTNYKFTKINFFEYFTTLLESQSNLLTKLDYSKHGINAIKLADIMVNSLPDENKIRLYIMDVISKQIEVNAKINNNQIIPNNLIKFENNLIPTNIPKTAGVYIFMNNNTKEVYVGSAMNFRLRLMNHKDQIMSKKEQIGFYKLLKDNNETLSNLSWGVVYSTTNYLTEFITNNPMYILNKGEVDILVHLTQLKPRILEQSLITALKPKYNKYKVLYQYSSWNINNLYQERKMDFYSKPVEIRVNNELLLTVPSMNNAAITLGVSRERVRLYLNKTAELKTNTMDHSVTLNEVGVTPTDAKVMHRTTPNHEVLELDGIKLTDLEPNKLYAFKSDKKTVFGIYQSAQNAAEILNPDKFKDKSARGKQMFIFRYVNLNRIVPTELGEFYFAENPNFKRNETRKKHVYLVDVVKMTATLFKGHREISRSLGISSKTLLVHLDKGTVYKENFLIYSEKYFNSLYPDSIGKNEYIIK